ncbi:FkbM family methyltransferase [Aeoliella sp.]|uniref:FkbM family methyltransferase n=1 Tax=Aeoliella sp. TaxID=2795800 RepID=UPI003CCBC6A9
MSARRTKWHHHLLGTVDERRRWRDIVLRRLGLARSNVPMELVRRRDWQQPNVVRALAADILLSQGTLSFVQVGAFDGTSEDDLTRLLPMGQVHGVLVEPQPEPFAELESRFADEHRLHLVNAAIAAERGEREMFRPRWGASRLASFDRENLLRHGVAAADIECHRVPCLPLDLLLRETGLSQLDVLQIDAEGHDLAVLATLDLDRWKPSIVRLEYLHTEPRELDRCIAQLAEQGYQFLVQNRDLVAVQANSTSRQAA